MLALLPDNSNAKANNKSPKSTLKIYDLTLSKHTLLFDVSLRNTLLTNNFLSFILWKITYLSIYLSICLSIFLSVYMSIYFSIYINLSRYISIHKLSLFFCYLFPINLSNFISFYLSFSFYLFIQPPLYLSINQSTYLIIYLIQGVFLMAGVLLNLLPLPLIENNH